MISVSELVSGLLVGVDGLARDTSDLFTYSPTCSPVDLNRFDWFLYILSNLRSNLKISLYDKKDFFFFVHFLHV
jgi:hypothetical protein